MTGGGLPALEAEYARLVAALDEGVLPDRRDAIRADIVALFHETERQSALLAEFKEGIRGLIARFKAQPTDAQPAISVRHDHIGASTFVERGWTELASCDWASAVKSLERAVALDATNLAAPALLGWALVGEERLDEARARCVGVLQRDPDHGLAQVGLGMVCLRTGAIAEAMEHLVRAASHVGDSRSAIYANYWLGAAYLTREMYEEAAEMLRRAVALGPNLAEGWAALGEAQWHLGARDLARGSWTLGADARHSPHASRCAALLDVTAGGGVPPRST